MNRLSGFTRLGLLLVFNLAANVVVVAGSSFVGLSPANASDLTPAQKLEMKQLYERATRAYDVGKYNEAIEEYQKAYEIGGDPPMLYNIAQAYRLNDQPQEALRFYRRYLQRQPTARNREDVERKIAELEKSIEDHRKAAAAATPPPVIAPPVVPLPVPAPSTTAPAPAPAPTLGPPQPVAPAASATPGTEIPAAPVEHGPSQSRQIVAWSLMGGGVLCGAGAVVAGLIARSKANDITNMSASSPPVTFNPDIEHQGKVANELAIGLGITGGALVAAGVIVLLTGDSSTPETPAQDTPPPSPPSAMVTPWLGPGLVGAGAGFRF